MTPAPYPQKPCADCGVEHWPATPGEVSLCHRCERAQQVREGRAS